MLSQTIRTVAIVQDGSGATKRGPSAIATAADGVIVGVDVAVSAPTGDDRSGPMSTLSSALWSTPPTGNSVAVGTSPTVTAIGLLATALATEDEALGQVYDAAIAPMLDLVQRGQTCLATIVIVDPTLSSHVRRAPGVVEKADTPKGSLPRWAMMAPIANQIAVALTVPPRGGLRSAPPPPPTAAAVHAPSEAEGRAAREAEALHVTPNDTTGQFTVECSTVFVTTSTPDHQEDSDDPVIKKSNDASAGWRIVSASTPSSEPLACVVAGPLGYYCPEAVYQRNIGARPGMTLPGASVLAAPASVPPSAIAMVVTDFVISSSPRPLLANAKAAGEGVSPTHHAAASSSSLRRIVVAQVGSIAWMEKCFDGTPGLEPVAQALLGSLVGTHAASSLVVMYRRPPLGESPSGNRVVGEARRLRQLLNGAKSFINVLRPLSLYRGSGARGETDTPSSSSSSLRPDDLARGYEERASLIIVPTTAMATPSSNVGSPPPPPSEGTLVDRPDDVTTRCGMAVRALGARLHAAAGEMRAAPRHLQTVAMLDAPTTATATHDGPSPSSASPSTSTVTSATTQRTSTRRQSQLSLRRSAADRLDGDDDKSPPTRHDEPSAPPQVAAATATTPPSHKSPAAAPSSMPPPPSHPAQSAVNSTCESGFGPHHRAAVPHSAQSPPHGDAAASGEKRIRQLEETNRRLEDQLQSLARHRHELQQRQTVDAAKLAKSYDDVAVLRDENRKLLADLHASTDRCLLLSAKVLMQPHDADDAARQQSATRRSPPSSNDVPARDHPAPASESLSRRSPSVATPPAELGPAPPIKAVKQDAATTSHDATTSQPTHSSPATTGWRRSTPERRPQAIAHTRAASPNTTTKKTTEAESRSIAPVATRTPYGADTRPGGQRLPSPKKVATLTGGAPPPDRTSVGRSSPAAGRPIVVTSSGSTPSRRAQSPFERLASTATASSAAAITPRSVNGSLLVGATTRRAESPRQARLALSARSTILAPTFATLQRTQAAVGSYIFAPASMTPRGAATSSPSSAPPPVAVITQRPMVLSEVPSTVPYRSSSSGRETNYYPVRLIRHHPWENPEEVAKRDAPPNVASARPILTSIRSIGSVVSV